MLSSSTLQPEIPSYQLTLFSSHEKPSKLPRKFSECQTNISSSFSSHSSFFLSNIDECFLELSSHSLPELSLLQIFSTQSLLPVSYVPSPISKQENFYFNSRLKILEWIGEVLSSMSLNNDNRNSIYYRFAYSYLIITGKLTEQKVFLSKNIFKIMIVALFLLCYKLEGFIVNRIEISNMIESFLRTVKIKENILNRTIKEMEVEICKLIDYDIFLIENNIYNISHMLLCIISHKILPNDEEVIHDIKQTLTQANYEIENINNSEIIFDLYPIEKGALSLISAIMIIIPEKKDECIEYFLNELNILYISKEQLIKYCDIIVGRIYNETYY